MITVTDVVEYCFCPRFAYFGGVLGLEQFEQKRGTVDAGKKVHKKYEKTNIQYIPSHVGKTTKKISETKLYSKIHGYVGKLDQGFFLEDNKFALLETKHTSWHHVGDTLRVQIGLLAVLAEENYNVKATKCIVVFTKDAKTHKIVPINEKLLSFALSKLYELKDILSSGVIPNATYDNRCVHCCYRNICSVGSLYSK